MTGSSDPRPMRPLSLAFTGSARELQLRSRRDFIVNLALGGLYTPVTRRRTAQYLASHTTLDGTPFAQVAVRASRWPAVLIVLALIALRTASEFGVGPPLPIVVICGVLALPYLWGSVTARTVGALRWRGLPLSFAARWSEVYAASWPLFVLGLSWAVAEPAVAAAAARPSIDRHVAALAAVAAVLAFPLVATLFFNLRRLRFTRTRVGMHALAWQARLRDYLRLWVLTAVAVFASAVLPLLLLRTVLFGSATLQGLAPRTAAAVYVASLALVVLLSTPARAWYEARSFALAWNGLRVGDALRVDCTLDAGAFARMRARDTWRTVASLGAHRCAAVVNAYQAKLSALQVRAEDGRPEGRS